MDDRLADDCAADDCAADDCAADDYRLEASEAPRPPETVFAEAVRWHRAGRSGEATRLYRQVLERQPRHAHSLHNLGVVMYQAGRHADAVSLISDAIAINGERADYHANLGAALRELGRLDEAEAACRRAIERDPGFAEAHYQLGSVLREQMRLEDARACYRLALRLRPAYVEAEYAMGLLLRSQERPDEAEACFRRALAIDPDYAEAHNILGTALRQRGRLDDAVASYRRACALKPDFAEAHTNLAMALLARGDMAAGWEEYEWRWRLPQVSAARGCFREPQWRGENAEGKTLLIHAEQGFGDTLQFCRYAPLAAVRGMRVILAVPKPLVRLLRGLDGVHMVVASGAAVPPFDLHCPMLSLPLAMRTTMATIPSATPYLRADAAKSSAWKMRLAAVPEGSLRVGLVWAGNPRTHWPQAAEAVRRRSLAPERLAPLLALPGVRFFSLQKDGPRAPHHPELTDCMDEMADFADTAALIDNLDLVVSVDTAVAHLAAALGKPVWLLDRFESCWRWLTGRRDSPWYPSLRLYRHRHPDDWDGILAAVAADLGDEVRNHRQGGARVRLAGRAAVPADRGVLFAGALRAHQDGRLAESERLCLLIVADHPDDPDAIHLLGVVTHRLGGRARALSLMKRAIALSPLAADYQANLGNMLREQGRLDEAVEVLARVIELAPDAAGAHFTLGLTLAARGQLEQAAASYRKAVSLAPDHADAHNNLGVLLDGLGRPDEAVACHRRVVALRPDCADARNGLGGTLTRAGLWREAVDCFQDALRLRPDFAEAHANLGMALLALGGMPAGWAAYEWRWRAAPMSGSRRDFAQPRWRGEPADGKTLLIHAEQGFGDTLQFCRYATLAAERGLRVILEVQAPLVRLLRSLPGVALVVARSEPLPPFDLHCPMLSMPDAAGTTLATIPAAAAYLRADPARVDAWRERLDALGDGHRVGLVWAGASRPNIPTLAALDRRRSLAFDTLAPLFAVPGLRFISLQKDSPTAPGAFPLADWMAEMTDFADTAALIANLDLVISVDTAVAHLAAALGKPVCLLSRFDACWRWMTGRRDSPWYPTLRLYRQPAPGAWGNVIRDVAEDLRALVAGAGGVAAGVSGRGQPARPASPAVEHLVAEAVRLHRAGDLAPAARAYRQVLAIDPDHADSLHLLGVIEHQSGRHEAAVEMIGDAIARKPEAATYHANLAAALKALGRAGEAIDSLRRAVQLKPDDVGAQRNLAALLTEGGRAREAIDCLRRVAALAPDLAEAHGALGGALRALFCLDEAVISLRRARDLASDQPAVHANLGDALLAGARWEEAAECYRAALALRPAFPEAHNNLGIACNALGRREEAIACFRQALALLPTFADACGNLAVALQEQGLAEAALACWRRVVELRPDEADGYNRLGYALSSLGRWEEAAACQRRSVALRPDDVEARCNLGVALEELGRLDEAAECHGAAIALRPDFAVAHTYLGVTRTRQGRWKAAEACFREAIALQPDDPEAHVNLGATLLSLGDMAAGWEEYEWRWKTKAMAQARLVVPQPQWRGEAAAGRTLLIHAEGGFGDTLQFCRYAPLARARGLRVILRVQRPLVRLLRGLDLVDLVLGSDEELPAFDLHCPMLSLPLAFGTTIETVPAIADLRLDPSRVTMWRTRLAAMASAGQRIGLAWAGNPLLSSPALAAMNRRRSLAPDLLAPLFDIAGPLMVSLQKGGPQAPARFALTDFMGEMADFADTAALIANLDLVIAVDTAVAHLAATLGKPVWLLNRFDSCWRWLAGRTDSPWYPNMRLYHQKEPGAWEPVVASVVADLRARRV